MKFKVIIHTDDDGSFWAEVPSLPGCFSHGLTKAELKINVREAITAYLEQLEAEGRKPEHKAEIFEVAV